MKREVPEYKVLYDAGKKNRYAVCVFVINEGEKVRKQLRSMKQYTDLVDVIVADGGSTDGSFEGGILEEAGVAMLLEKTGPGKLSAQMRMAFDCCLNKGYDGVVVIDGNGKDGLDALPEFIEKLNAGYDHIQGSRFIPGGHHENTPLIRYFAVNLLHAPLISLAAGFRYTDTTNGFRAYSADLLGSDKLLIFRNCFDRYQLHYYLAIEAAREGYKICEVPVSRVYPAEGKTPTKIKGLRGPLGVLRQLVDVCLGKYKPS